MKIINLTAILVLVAAINPDAKANITYTNTNPCVTVYLTVCDIYVQDGQYQGMFLHDHAVAYQQTVSYADQYQGYNTYHQYNYHGSYTIPSSACFASSASFSFSGGGGLNVGSSGSGGGTVPLGNGASATMGSNGTATITIPGGPTVSIGTNGTISVSGGPVLTPGSGVTASLPGGITVSAGGNGISCGVSFPDGTIVNVGTSGIASINFPNGMSVGIGQGGILEVTLPPGMPPAVTNAINAAQQVIQNGSNVVWQARQVINAVNGVFGTAIPLPSTSLGGVDFGITEGGTFQIGVKVGNDNIVWMDLRLATEQRIVLLLHGMNSNTDTWNALVASDFGASSIMIRDRTFRPFPTSTPGPTAGWVRSYRLRFGYFDQLSTRVGVEGITSAPGSSYPTNDDRCGDFQTFDDLAQEVDDAIALIRDRHKNARILLVGHSRGGLAARQFLQRPGTTENKRAVIGLLTTSGPHHGSRLGRIYHWFDTHPRSNFLNQNDWEVANLIRSALDIRRPTIDDLADTSAPIAALNAQAAVSQLPSSVTYAEIINAGTHFGKLGLWGPVPDFSVFGPDILWAQLSQPATDYILEGISTWALSGDGIVPSPSQTFTSFPGFLGRTVERLVTTGEILHAGATDRVQDLRFQLRVMRPAWFPSP